MRLVCVVPAFGHPELTRAVVRSALLELSPAQVVVVDNSGDFAYDDELTVLRPGTNLGWLRGCNAGLEHAFGDRSVEGVVLLNNDVTLSAGFFTGLAAAASNDTGLVAPCYDDNSRAQHRYWSGPADVFPARPVEVPARVVDGTCLLVTRTCFERVGLLDEERFGRFGWGAEVDLCARTRAAGLQVLVTQRAYLNHMTAVTAETVTDGYQTHALAEMTAGLVELYGPSWRTDLGFDVDGTGPGGLRGKPYYALRRLRLLLRR